MPHSSENWDWEEDEYGERAIPHVTPAPLREVTLRPRPPHGWVKVIDYDSVPPVDTPQLGAWLYCLGAVQSWEADRGRVRQAHMICRDANGWRVLVVHPDVAEAADMAVESMNSVLTHCNCGGYDCLEPTLQNRASRVLARRACDRVDPAKLPELFADPDLDPELLLWAELPLSQRARLVEQMDLDPAVVLEATHWLDALPREDTALFEQLAHQAARIAGGVPRSERGDLFAPLEAA